MGGRGASSSSKIKAGDYEYTKGGANLLIKVMDVKGNKILARVAGNGPSGGFYNGNLVETTPNSEMIKGMRKKRR